MSGASVSPASPAAATGGGLTDAQLRATPVPVSGSGVFHVDDNASTLSVDDGGGALTVDGTVTVANPTTNPETGLAKDSTLTGGTQKTKIVDTGGTNVAAVSAAGAVKTDGSAVTQPVSGTFWQAAQPVTDNAGSLTVDSPQLPAALAAGGGIKVEGVAGGVAQPVSGTVTANAGSGPFPVSDNAGSLTVDAPVGTPVFVRLSDGSAAIATLPVSLAANQSVNLAQVAGAAASTGSRVTDTGVQSVFQAAPIAANILVGHVAQTATTAAATIITIPSNRTWVGTITVACDVGIAAASTTAGQALGTITTVGANVTPAAATVVTCEARAGANAAAGTVGAQGANSITVPMVVNTGAASATLALASTQAGTASRVSAICSGYLI